MAHFVVTAVGEDRPGIVAAVTKAFVDLGCNLEDTSAAILRGYFALILIVAAPSGVSAETVEKSLLPPAKELGLAITVREVDASAASRVEGERWTISVYGADKPGIVNRFTTLLAERKINILDMTTRVTGDPDEPVYTMVLEVALPPQVIADQLEIELQDLAMDLQVESSLQLSEADLL